MGESPATENHIYTQCHQCDGVYGVEFRCRIAVGATVGWLFTGFEPTVCPRCCGFGRIPGLVPPV